MTDEELGKRDDDRKPRRSALSSQPGLSLFPFRYRKRRILVAIALLFVGWILLRRWQASTEEAKISFEGWKPEGPGYQRPVKKVAEEAEEPKGAPPGTPVEKQDEGSAFFYNGRIRFFRLANTLYEAAGYGQYRKNVFFMASNLQSASKLIPMACDMSQWKKNQVHFALVGRNDIPIEEIQKINGVDRKECKISWHDARPDYTEFSSDVRAESSVISAVTHIDRYLKAQAYVIDDSKQEDSFFVRGIYAQTELLRRPVVEIPSSGAERFQWLARLEASTLAEWHKPNIDILIHAPRKSAASLLRLFRSLEEADYTGLKPPRLILDLPSDIDPTVKDYISKLAWPPSARSDVLADNRPIIRHRIPDKSILPEEAALRFLESFYPNNWNSHVLLLSTQAQLSPVYFHYLKYAILEYRYSLSGHEDNTNIMGLSLEYPTSYLNGTAPFKKLGLGDMLSTEYLDQGNADAVPFLWEAPNSNGALYFGDKWAELHSFLAKRVAAQQQEGAKTKPKTKLVSENLPAWTEYCLEFMRARAYSLLYPGTTSTNSLITVHTELFQPPEEFEHPAAVSRPSPENDPDAAAVDPAHLKALSAQPFLAAPDAPGPSPPPRNAPEPAVAPGSLSLQDILPFDAALPAAPHLPHLDHLGRAYASTADAATVADAFAARFRREQGGCLDDPPQGTRRKVFPGDARDLFCDGDEDEAEFEQDETVRGQVGEGAPKADDVRAAPKDDEVIPTR